jgi:hypothetical protein
MLASTLGLAADGPATKSKQSAKKKATPVADELRQFKDQLAQQQSQMKQQQDQINQLQQQLQESKTELQQKTEQLQGSVQQASQQASAAQEAASTLNSSVSELKTNNASFVQSLQDTQKKVSGLENPLAIHYKGITITPGGFASADFLVRSRNENADVSSSYTGLPFGGVANSKLSEFRLSGRSSRLSLLAEGKAGDSKLTGYWELDFLGQAPTANQLQSNSFTPRIRQAWGQVDFKNGFTVTAGQTWSLITTDRQGIATRAEFIPSTIESSYVVGYNYARQASVRLTDKFNKKVAVAFEVANPETAQPVGSNLPSPLFGFNNSENALSPNGSTLNNLAGSCTVPTGITVNGTVVTAANQSSFACNPSASAIINGLSTNLSPDLIAKAAFDPGWGHYEIKALARFFRDRYNGHNLTTEGGGIGAAAILPVVAKKADFIFEGLAGRGIGRYAASNSPDVTLNPTGHIIPLKTLHAMGGLELHPTPKLDVYFYGGDEYYGRSAYKTSATKATGYGSPLVNNVNCGEDYIPSGTCTGQNKNLWDATAGLWYRFYKGSFGTFQWGAQFEHLERSTWSGILGTGVPAGGAAPKGLDNVAMSSFRFILP